MFQVHAFGAPQVENRQIASAVEDVLVGVPQQFVAMADKGAQRFAVGLAGEVHHDVLKVLTQGAEQHVQLGRAGVLKRLVAVAVRQNAQATGGDAEGAVDQRAVQAPQMAQGITEVERALQPQQRETVATGQAQIQQQGLLVALLHHEPQVAGQQGAIGVALRAVHHRQAAQLCIGRDGRQALAQASDQPGHLAGARTIRDKIPRPGAHGVEHQLVVHAIAQGHDGQHRLGFQRAFNQGALSDHFLAVQPHEHQPGEGHVHQRQQLIQAASAGAHHLADGRQRALQPFKVGVVAR